MEHWLAGKRHRLAKALILNKTAGGRLLDLGCGNYPAFLETMEGFERHGLDRQDLAVPHWMRYVRQDISEERSLPFDAGYFDAVSALALIEHLDRTEAFSLLREARRVLKGGGVLVLTTPAEWTRLLLRGLALLNVVSAQEINEHKSGFSKRSLQKLLSEAGFRNIRTGSFELGMNLLATAEK